MRVMVMGAGGVGGYYGALMARHGHDVTFVARGAHPEAMVTRGLEVRFGEETALVKPVRAAASPAEAGSNFELILFTVKGYDTQPAAAAIGPVLTPDTAVLTLQNGVESADLLSRMLGAEHILVGTTYIFAEILQPGIISVIPPMRRIVFGELSGELTPRAEAIADAMRESEIDARVTTDPRLAIWQKYVGLAGFSTATSVCQVPIGALVSNDDGLSLLRVLVSETIEVGRASGVPLPVDAVDRVMGQVMSLPPTGKSSMQRDFEGRRRTELEQITGVVVRLGRELSVPTPAFDIAYAILKVRGASFATT